MIKQCGVTDIESRSECNPFDSTGFLPLIVAPMYSCVDKHNAHIFLENKIKVCMPRKEYMDETYTHCSNENYFDSYSLQEFIENFIESEQGFLNDSNFNKIKTSVCIDTAVGHLKKLHDAIRKAKEIHGDKLIIMAGNVASVESFVELAKTGVDYIRVGIGGGGGCNTTSNTGVGQKNLAKLIRRCKQIKPEPYILKKFEQVTTVPFNYSGHKWSISNYQDALNISKVKIVADGISSYIKLCQEKYGFNDNGYAAINKLLFAGADLVMIGSLFAQCLESAGEKTYNCGVGTNNWKTCCELMGLDENNFSAKKRLVLDVKYSGMSTQQEQKKYQPYLQNLQILGDVQEIEDGYEYTVQKEGDPYQNLKPSEGSIKWLPVRWTLLEWLEGNDRQDESPYLMGWINSIKSAMSYAGIKSLT